MLRGAVLPGQFLEPLFAAGGATLYQRGWGKGVRGVNGEFSCTSDSRALLLYCARCRHGGGSAEGTLGRGDGGGGSRIVATTGIHQHM